MFKSTPPGRTKLFRGDGSVCSTPTYQKMSCTSWGVLRTNSMKASAMLRTSQLTDRRITPTSRPSSVAVTIAIAATNAVLRKQTSNVRP